MHALSISRAWDESKAIIARDGQLYVSVALALVALPMLVSGLVNPRGMVDSEIPAWVGLVSLAASLIAFAGELAMIRLAIGPSITVGGAIGHGIRRMPIYILAAVMLLAVFFIIAIPFATALVAMGVPVTGKALPATPPVLVAVFLYAIIVIFIGVRMSLSAATASAEATGPFGVLKRSWQLSYGNFWRLLGFLLVYFVAALAIMIAISAALGAVVALAFGAVTPMSMSALILALVHALMNAVLTGLLAIMLARIYVQLAGRGATDSGVPITG